MQHTPPRRSPRLQPIATENSMPGTMEQPVRIEHSMVEWISKVLSKVNKKFHQNMTSSVSTGNSHFHKKGHSKI